MGLTGLLLLAFCLLGFAASMLQVHAQAVARDACSDQQSGCPIERVELRSTFWSAPYATGPPRWFWPVQRWLFLNTLNHSVGLCPVSQAALPSTTLEATALVTVG